MGVKLKYTLVAILSSITTALLIFLVPKFFFNLSMNDLGNLGRLAVAYQAATHAYVQPVDNDMVAKAGIKGMLDSLGDQHTMYLDEATYNALLEQNQGNFSGIGVVIHLDDDHKVVAAKVMEDSPAAKAGMKDGDIITAINHEPTKDLKLSDVVEKVRGPIGTDVTLTVERDGKPMDVKITREAIDYKTVDGKMLKDHIGYISIAMFNEKTAEQFTKELNKLKSENMQGLVIDLRDNPGGLLSSVVSVGKEVLPAGKIVSIINRQGQRTTYEVDKQVTDVPMVVLVNKNSASAAELLAGALQDTNTAVVMGEKSYGKGSVQVVWPLLKNDGLKVTIAKYYTPKMRSIDKEGVKPDIEVKNDIKGQDTQLTAATAKVEELIKEQKSK